MQSVARPIQIPATGLDSPVGSARMQPPATVAGAGGNADELPRTAKFLCSFGGSILPRPLDGRLRYVGGETRIVTVARDISYADFLARMRELFEGADIIKYQQPDEDLDALVSVLNDDDVMHMMEEYDKLIAAGEGFTRLRIFLFSQQLDGDATLVAAHYDGDEWETERRYVDALNSVGDAKSPTSPVSVEQLFGLGTNDVGIPSHVSLRHLNVPRPSYGQRYAEVDSPWSPSYVSPGHYGVHDPRDYPISPSSARFHVGVEDFHERISDEFVRHSPQSRHYDNHSPSHVENIVWLPPGAIIQEKAGFPGNLGRSSTFLDGTNICDHCRSSFQMGQSSSPDARYLDPRWRHVHPHFEQPSMMNEYGGYVAKSCADCFRSRDHYVANQDVRLENGVYVKEQSDHLQTFYNEPQTHDRSWHHLPSSQGGHRYEDPRVNLSGTGRTMEPYAVDGNIANSQFAHGKIYEMNSASFSRANHENVRYFHRSTEHGNDIYHNQQIGAGGSYAQSSGFEEVAGQHCSQSSMYGTDTFYQMQQNLPPIQSLRRKVHVPVHAGPPYELPSLQFPSGVINSSYVRNTPDGSPKFPGVVAYDRIPNPWPAHNDIIVSHKIVGPDMSAAAESYLLHGSRVNPNATGQVVLSPDVVQCQPAAPFMEVRPERACTDLMPSTVTDGKEVGSAIPFTHHSSKLEAAIAQTLEHEHPEDKYLLLDAHETKYAGAMNKPAVLSPCAVVEQSTDVYLKRREPVDYENHSAKVREAGASALQECGNISEERLNFLPELIASVKKAALEDVGEVPKAQSNAGSTVLPACGNEESKLDEIMMANIDAEVPAESNGSSEHQKISKIEPTTAEAEALAKGLQTIKNDDLEEIRELGSGTYGAVYHGKWRGSDVAIKRIKASCFAGRPSERERLIADFWREALILSSLHHPNVVSFYGVVRDGPDGSLATVTEFMVNGSLKQFLQKKDRTIDRRKRLILAMDAAFGMEYLHGKNIVHFDLKCENLLVNMRDPHRPICKIGDLGLSKVKQHTLVSGGVRGTLPWMAPELLSGKSNMVSEKIDVYSFGIVMWELLTGEEPYADMRCASIIGGIVNNTLRPQIPSWCDPEWKSLMESCWAADPAERPSFSEISQKLRKMAAAMNVK